MIAFPPCKINIGLQVLQKRSDGFHNIQTVFYPVPLKDVLEIIHMPGNDQPAIYNYGLPVPGAAAGNTCIKAWLLLKKDYPELPPVQIHLLKNIPMGAGLGGGSSDGASMLQLLNEKFHLNLSPGQLMDYALQLGSDCPFFIVNQPSHATGRGEILEPIHLHLSSWQLVLVHPGIHINTGWAFGQLVINNSTTNILPLKDLLLQPVAAWKDQVINDFEIPVFEQYPEIQSIKENLYRLGAVYASMSGSGSTVFGLFDKDRNLTGGLPAHYTVICL